MTVVDVLNEKEAQIIAAKELEDVVYTVEDIQVLMDLAGLRTLKFISRCTTIRISAWTDSTIFTAIKEGKVHGHLAVLIFSALRNPAIIGSVQQVFSEVFQ